MRREGVDGTDENNYRSLVNQAIAKENRPVQSQLRRVPIEALLGDNREVVIVHNGREYRLRITQNGKLILTA